MRKAAFLTLALFAMSAAGAWWMLRLPPSPEPIHTRFTLSDITLVVPGESRTPDATVSVSDGRLRIGPGAAGGALLSEYAGHYVLPGFIDMHTHLPPESLLGLTRHYGLLHLAHGVTTIRDAGDIDGTAVPAARRALEAGHPFPRLYSCGPFVSAGKPVWPNTILMHSPAEAGSIVAQIATEGHSCIKAYDGLSPEQIAALVEAAGKRSMPVLGHVPDDLAYEEAGLPDVQHFFGVPPAALKSQARSVVARNGDWSGVSDARLDGIVEHVGRTGTRNTPTLGTLAGFARLEERNDSGLGASGGLPSLYSQVIWDRKFGLPVYRRVGPAEFARARAALRLKMRLVLRLAESGAKLHIGTDAGQPYSAPGSAYWRELRLFEESGVPPEQVLAYATTVPGEVIGHGAGRLFDGGPADFLIFSEDPTADLDALDSLVAVVIGGRLYTRGQLDDGVTLILDHYESWPLRPISHWLARRKIEGSARDF
ncbi:amidohydrolase family protein [Qipengyuania qiaonensis]|uniref:Amidohydrolase family protein n=1 Tax=Qipengyuania qiaonensis TaxID=2867240 RepID=A0ABS7J4F3_9SPHN|nr:amidohydrolase family protein [Qipengyuania qiaonensis]MBX7482151.1 amidohydrolase family protein [Qipengyuania qiaonensis]